MPSRRLTRNSTQSFVIAREARASVEGMADAGPSTEEKSMQERGPSDKKTDARKKVVGLRRPI